MADYSFLREIDPNAVPAETFPATDQILHRIGYDATPANDKLIVRLASGTSQSPREGGTGNLEYAGPRPAANVRAFGAVGNDIVDDTVAFQAAINALPATGGMVLIPAGVYRLAPDAENKTLEINKPITFQGIGEELEVVEGLAVKYGSAIHVATDASLSVRIMKALSDSVTFSKLSFYWNEDDSILLVPLFQTAATPNVEFSNWRFENCLFDRVALRCTSAPPRQHLTSEFC